MNSMNSTNSIDSILEHFKSSGALLEGHFILSSGLHSPKYLQCALALQQSADAAALGRQIAEHFGDLKIDTVASPAIGERRHEIDCIPLLSSADEGRMVIPNGPYSIPEARLGRRRREATAASAETGLQRPADREHFPGDPQSWHVGGQLR